MSVSATSYDLNQEKFLITELMLQKDMDEAAREAQTPDGVSVETAELVRDDMNMCYDNWKVLNTSEDLLDNVMADYAVECMELTGSETIFLQIAYASQLDQNQNPPYLVINTLNYEFGGENGEANINACDDAFDMFNAYYPYEPHA